MGRILGSGVEALKSFARKCLDAGGVPIFRPRYGGRRLPENSVIVACWGKGNVVKGGTVTHVPTDVIEKMEKTKGDYKWLLSYT